MRTIFIFLVSVQIAQAAQLTPAQLIRRLRKNDTEATSQTRSSVAASLRSIVIPEMKELDGYTMTEVLTFLDAKIKVHNPNINLIVIPLLNQNIPKLNQNIPNTATNAVAPKVIDPVTGLPMLNPAAPIISNVFNPDDVKIVGLRTLRNLNALQIIELITLSFNAPVQYVITSYGVVFFHLPADQAGQVSRMFKIKPNTFNNGTPPTLGGSNTNQRPNTPGIGRAFR